MANTLWVGANETYKTLAAAVKASGAGDTIFVRAGTYHNDFVETKHALNIIGVDGKAHFTSDRSPPNGKGIITSFDDLYVQNLEFSGAWNYSSNGTGIRHQGGSLTVKDSYFHDSQGGILCGNNTERWPGESVTIDNCEFKNLGGQLSHGIYINSVENLTVTNSTFTDIHIRHHIKSRADFTVIENNVLKDGPTGTSSYLIDLPNGGHGIIRNNYLEKGALSSNPNLVSFAGEGTTNNGATMYNASSLVVEGNTFVNHYERPNMPVNAVRNHHTVPTQMGENTYTNVDNAVKGLSVPYVSTDTTSAPVAVDDAAAAKSGVATTVAVLANDTDADGDAISLAGVQTPAHGVVKVNTDGTLTYTSAADYSGTDTFTYTIKDATGKTDQGSVTVTVTKPVVPPPAPAPAPTDYDKVPTVQNAVFSSTSKTLTASQTNLVLNGTAKINGTGNGADNIMVGNAGNNTLAGQWGNDTLYGGAGNDVLNGGQGDDLLYGGLGKDRLIGGEGMDKMAGGSGADTFVIQSTVHSNPEAADTILDFIRSQGDRVELSGIDAQTNLSGNQAFKFIGTGGFSGHAGELRYGATDKGVVVQGDVNGDRIADVQFDMLNVTSLQATDFVL